jgi:ankyrin repeat protein
MGEDADETRTALARGGDPNVVNEGGNSALLLASRTACPEIVKALLDAGANANSANSGGDTPLSSATLRSQGAEGDRKSRFGQVIELLKASGAR